MKTDIQLRDGVLKELGRQPSINTAATVMMVNDGVITLDNHMSRFPEECEAVNAAQRVAGDKVVADKIAADKIEVNLPGIG
jgi:hypothetical protein